MDAARHSPLLPTTPPRAVRMSGPHHGRMPNPGGPVRARRWACILASFLAGSTVVVSAVAEEPQRGVTIEERSRADYDPIGVPAGAFLLYPSIELGVRRDDNIHRTRSAKTADTILSIRPSVRAVSQWSNHGLGLEAAATADDYRSHSDENKRDWFAILDGRLDVLRDTELRGALSVFDLEEEPDDPNSATAGTPGDHTRWVGRLSASHRINRFGFATTASYSALSYDEASKKGLDRGELELSGQVGYRMFPEYGAFVRTTFHHREYERLTGRFDRDSRGWELVGGAELDLGGLVVGEIFAGWRRQDYEDAALRTISEPALGLAVDWNITQLTTLGANAQRSVFETETRASGVLTTAVGLDVAHELRRNLILRAAAGLSHERPEVVVGERRETSDILSVDVGGTWLLDRTTRLEFGYRHEHKDATAPGERFEANILSLNLLLQI